MYRVGDHVAHPMHGAGTISEIRQERAEGKVRAYYVLTLLSGGLQLLIPCDASEKAGLRPILSEEEAEQLVADFSKVVAEKQPNWNRRYRENMLRIKTGDLHEVAKVIVSLIGREKRQMLSTGERKILASARQILASELALAKKLTLEEGEALLKPLEEK